MNQSEFNMTITHNNNNSFKSGFNLSSSQIQFCHTLQNSIEMDVRGPIESSVAAIICNLIAGFFTSASNLMIFFTIIRKEQLRTAANLVLTSMALSDFLVGLVVQPLKVIHIILQLTGSPSCVVKRMNSYTGIICVGVSLFNICLFSVDRFIATVVPYRYLEDAIYNKYLFIILFAWLAFILTSGLTYASVLDASIMHRLTSMLFVCCLVVVLVCYGVIYRIVCAQRKRFATVKPISLPKKSEEEMGSGHDKAKHSNPIELSSIATDPNAPEITNASIQVKKATVEIKDRANDEHVAFKKQKSRNKTIFIIIAAFIAWYMPVTILKAIKRNRPFSDATYSVLLNWTNTLVLLNSCINPVIYCWRVTSIRNEIKKVLSCLYNAIRPIG